MDNELKAKVFISCGQRPGEKGIAIKISKLLKKLGYDPYLAVEQSKPKGLKESILKQLEDSEYYIFVDFKRERCVAKNGKDSEFFRGSLFTHQELAIASYLEIEMLSFREEGVKLDDGIAGILHLKRNIFIDESDLLRKIENEVRSKWKPNWKNALKLYFDPKAYEDVNIITPTGLQTRFYHIQVKNLHKKKIARNCIAYISSMKNMQNGKQIKFLSSELKWAGYSNPNVNILPQKIRELDAFYVLHQFPTVLNFNSFATSGLYMQPIHGPGRYELEYFVVSDNMPTITQKFHVLVRKTIKGIEFKHV